MDGWTDGRMDGWMDAWKRVLEDSFEYAQDCQKKELVGFRSNHV